MDENVADIIRRLNKWREDTRVAFENLAKRSDENKQAHPDEVSKTLIKKLAFYSLATKYNETMAQLFNFIGENNTEDNRSNFPELAWWQKVRKLFEIEESFYKQAKEAFAAANRIESEIYSGLATDALRQISDAIEKVNKTTYPETETNNVPKLAKAGWWQSWSPDEKSGIRTMLCIALGIGALFYALHFFDALSHPWTLWKSEWSESYGRDINRVMAFDDVTPCYKEVRKRLADDLQSQRRADEVLEKSMKLKRPKTYMVVGKTLLEFGQSSYATIDKLRDSYFKMIDENNDLTENQKQWAKRDALLPEIQHSVTFFCTPTAPRLYWPFYTPDTSFVMWSDLADEGRRTLATIASKRFESTAKE
jgi:hypothetical protein